jgi:dethiobiotin synthetase
VLRGCFVTATDTGVGKTILAGALVASLRARGEAVRARKPVITGVDDDGDRAAPRDHELLAALSGERPETVSPARYGPAVSPHLAAELAGHAIDVGALLDDVRGAGPVIVEGIGGPRAGTCAGSPANSGSAWWSRRVQGLERSTTRCSRLRRRDRPASTYARSS